MPSRSPKNTRRSAVSDSAEKKHRFLIIGIGIVSAVSVWFFGFRPFLVSGLSMYPAFNASFVNPDGFSLVSGDYLIIDIFSYLFVRDPERFDVVVAQSPIEPGQHLLKRIIGLPNERIHLSEDGVTISTPDGEDFFLREPYVNRREIPMYKDQIVRLGADQYFLLGDNRTNSLDSRVWGGLTKDNIVGRVILRLYPFGAITLNPGSVDRDLAHTL